MDLRAETIDRWASTRRCRQKHPDGCPHSKKHWHPRVSKGRRDIQGLRAFAVLAVIIDHLTGWPGGGFIGVDVFFVISGFLITGLLVREHETTDHISFVGFYRRRIKRIIPAAVVVLIVTVVASQIVFIAARARSITVDAVWALLFGANWRFGLEEVNYFNQDLPHSPIQHYWSLSIEEQFYFVWPWVMLLAFGLLLRRNHSRAAARVVVGTLIGAITVASFVYAMWQTQTDAYAAYFSTFSRIWELGLGATLAVAAPLAWKIPNAIRPLLAWVGLVAMVSACWLIQPDATFPAPWAALPVVAAALTIAAGTYQDHTKQIPFFFPLTNPASRYTGDISYSLYLWHWPIIVIAGEVWGDAGTQLVIYGVAIAAVSALSYHLIEQPFREATWPTGGGPWAALAEMYRPHRTAAVVGLCLFTLGLTAFVLRPTDPPIPSFTQADAEQAAEQGADLPPEVQNIQDELTRALQSSAWPSGVTSSANQVISGGEAPDDVMQCGVDSAMATEDCTFGDPAARRHAVMLGDSLSLAYVEAIRSAFQPGTGWKVTSLGASGCAFSALETIHDVPELDDRCPIMLDRAIRETNRLKPDVVFVTQLERRDRVEGGEVTIKEWQAGVSDELAKIKAPTKVVLLQRPPNDKDIQTCFTKVSVPSDCVSDVTDAWGQQFLADQQLAATLPNAMVLDPRSWFCVLGNCPAYAGDMLTKMDAYHLNPAFAEHIGPAVWATLTSERALPAS